jgi:hypothetical protein
MGLGSDARMLGLPAIAIAVSPLMMCLQLEMTGRRCLNDLQSAARQPLLARWLNVR